MKKIILGLATVLSVGAVVAGATGAFFGDTETSSGNTISAGAIDLKIDNTSYYNDVLNPGTSWSLDDLDGKLFFNFLDLKPGDEGEDTISVHVNDNDAWACMDIALTAKDDNGLTEPEEGDGDTTGGEGQGELQQEINFVWWKDDGDNVLEIDEEGDIFEESTLGGLNGFAVPLADTSGNAIFGDDPLVGKETYYIGKAWCYGSMVLNPLPEGDGGPDVRPNGVECDGSELDNTTQTDGVRGNLTFTAVQSRNNDSFLCNGGGFGCNEKVDVMLVLDKSSSIGSGELATLKTAAKAFVDALAPSADGVHVGMASFSTTASIGAHLTSDGASVKTAIDSLGAGGFTNLQHGIKLARIELENPGDGHDRADSESPDIMLIITDGEPNRCDDAGTACSVAAAKAVAKTQADLAKGDGNGIFAVGVGITPSNAAFMKDDIVSLPVAGHYFGAESFSDLSGILADLVDCPNGGTEPVTILNDGFGTGDTSPVIAGWEKHEDETVAQAPSGSSQNAVSPNGGRFASIADDSIDAGTEDGWICREIVATGLTSLTLSYYWRGDPQAEIADKGLVQYFTGGTCASPTGGPNSLASHDMINSASWNSNSIDLPGALDNTTFLLRFYNNSNANTEDFRVDGVLLKGM